MRHSLVHLLVLFVLLPASALAQADQWEIESTTGERFIWAGDYKGAEEHFRKALAIAERYNLDDRHKGGSCNGIATALRYQDKHAEAEPFFRRALELRQKALPAGDTRIADSADGLGASLLSLGKPAEAEPYLLKALGIWDRTPNMETCPVARTMNVLALSLQYQRKFDKAEAMYNRAMRTIEKAIWEDPDSRCRMIVTILDNLGSLYTFQEQYEAAAQLYARGIPLLEKQFGADSIDVGRQRLHLANAYNLQNKYDLAEPEYQRGIKILGSDPQLAISELPDVLRNYKGMLERAGKKSEAAAVQQRIDAANELNSQATVDPRARWQAWADKAFAAEQKNQIDEALKDIEPAIEAARQIRPPDATLMQTMQRKGDLLQRQAKIAEARAVYQQTVAAVEEQFGKDSDFVSDSLSLVGAFEHNQKNDAAAEAALKRALAIQEKIATPASLRLYRALNQLAELYYLQQHYDKAEPLYLRALEVGKRAFGSKEFMLTVAYDRLAGVYKARKQYAKAEAYYRLILQLEEKEFGASSSNIGGALSQLADILRAQGNTSEAERLEARRQELQNQSIHPTK